MCGTSTLWRRAGDQPVSHTAPSRLSPVAADEKNSTDSIPHSIPDSPDPLTLGSGRSELGVAKPTVMVERRPPASALPDIGPTEVIRPPWDHTTNRRRGVRGGRDLHRVHTSCRFRDEVVECDNISRGGVCFRSRKQYHVDSPIEVAAPYSPGWQAIFVAATIKHVEVLPGGTLYRYGVAYIQPLKSSRNS